MLLGYGYMRNNLVHLGGYSTQRDVADMSNFFHFCSVFIRSRGWHAYQDLAFWMTSLLPLAYYWIVVTWQHDQGVTWHVDWGLLIPVTTLLSLWALYIVKVKMKFFWFFTWPPDRSVTWLCGWDPFILSHHPAKFGIRRPCESGNITLLICHVTTWLICYETLWVGSLHPRSPFC